MNQFAELVECPRAADLAETIFQLALKRADLNETTSLAVPEFYEELADLIIDLAPNHERRDQIVTLLKLVDRYAGKRCSWAKRLERDPGAKPWLTPEEILRALT